MTKREIKCDDCGVNVIKIGESRYMLRPTLWREVSNLYGSKVLCIGCVESRIGRRLDVHDFDLLMANQPDSRYHSARLLDRLGDMAERNGEAMVRTAVEIHRHNDRISLRHS